MSSPSGETCGPPALARGRRAALRPRGVPAAFTSANARSAQASTSGNVAASLPPSVLGVIEADRSTGDFVPLRNATLGEWNLPTDFAVVGSRMLTINVE